MAATERSLMSLTMKWLASLVLLDAALLVAFVAPELAKPGGAGAAVVAKLTARALVPLIVLLLVNIIPSSAKFRLLYWKGNDGLPGAQAFSRHGPNDPRVDMAMLARNVGALPQSPSEQNATWYRLYRQVEGAPSVREAHRVSLMYRDMAALSAVLGIIVPLVFWLVLGNVRAAGLSLTLFAVQYAVVAIGGRGAGTRFVCNVLAEHCVRRVATTARAPRSASPGSRKPKA